MEFVKNPKLEGSRIWDCRPQTGLCPHKCNQCFYNRPNAFYTDINSPSIPDPEEVGDDIVRMNCGHDSNINWELVIQTAVNYKNYFFNTSIQNLDFPGPVVLTANPKEEEEINMWRNLLFKDNLMFFRVRVSPTNYKFVEEFIDYISGSGKPVVLTIMSYYDQIPPGVTDDGYLTEDLQKIYDFTGKAYEWKVRHINSYWCPTPGMIKAYVRRYFTVNHMTYLCGTADSGWCKDCGNCELFYRLTMKDMELANY